MDPTKRYCRTYSQGSWKRHARLFHPHPLACLYHTADQIRTRSVTLEAISPSPTPQAPFLLPEPELTPVRNVSSSAVNRPQIRTKPSRWNIKKHQGVNVGSPILTESDTKDLAPTDKTEQLDLVEAMMERTLRMKASDAPEPATTVTCDSKWAPANGYIRLKARMKKSSECDVDEKEILAFRVSETITLQEFLVKIMKAVGTNVRLVADGVTVNTDETFKAWLASRVHNDRNYPIWAYSLYTMARRRTVRR